MTKPAASNTSNSTLGPIILFLSNVVLIPLFCKLGCSVNKLLSLRLLHLLEDFNNFSCFCHFCLYQILRNLEPEIGRLLAFVSCYLNTFHFEKVFVLLKLTSSKGQLILTLNNRVDNKNLPC